MKALVKKFRKPGLWMEDVPPPKIGNNDVLIKTKKTSICGTDIHIYKWDAWAEKTIPVPMIVGHEFMGEIVEVGKDVSTLKVGDRVSGEGHLTCSTCPNCLMGQKHLCMHTLGVGVHTPGAFAEYLSLPAENVFALPDNISDELASIFDPLGNAVHTALSFDITGEDVLITGAGPIGIMATAIAKKAGARHVVITDHNAYRLSIAKKMGATKAVNIQTDSLESVCANLGIPYGFKVGMEMSGNEKALSTLLKNIHHGGNIALLGIFPGNVSIDWDLVIFKMLTLKGIYGREIFSTWFKMTKLIQAGLDLTPIITHRFPIENFEEGFQTMLSGQSGKVILDWT